MTAKKKISLNSVIVTMLGMFAVAFVLNWIAVKMGFRPFVYCGLKDIGWQLIQPWQVLVSLCGCTILVWGLLKGNVRLAIGGAFLCMLVYLVPEWGRVLFSHGISCVG